ncbi:MAG: hypothetical protein NC039_04965 [Muribaculaceae bacterium]|nr:hypothetical protein [Muribaculaceae bacterium]
MIRIISTLVTLVAFTIASYGQTGSMTIEQVFNEASNIEGFQKLGYIEDDIKFPKEIGTPEMIAHGNAEPRDAVLALLSKLPTGSLVYDDTDERGKFDRIFLDKQTYNLLYVHIGRGGNDSVLVLFRGGSKDAIEKFLKDL